MKIRNMKFRIDLVLLSVIMLVTIFLPFAKYTYNQTSYTLSGLDFILGKSICGNSILINTEILLVTAIIAIALVLILSLLSNKIKPAILARVTLVMSILTIAAGIKLATGTDSKLQGAKNTGISFGLVMLIIFGALALVSSVYTLRKIGKISSLDFMVLPGLTYFIINNYIPMAGIVIAFKKIDYSVGIWDSPWTGLDNFKMLFSYTGSFFNSDAWIITRNTLLYNAAFIVLGIIFGVIAGFCLHDIISPRLKKFYQTSILLPQLISMVIVAYIVYGFLSNETGMLNKLMGENSINFYATKKYWPFILIFIYVWKQIGYNAIIFLSSLVGIDRSIYEASRVDGATKWQTLKHITLPMIKPTVISLGLLQVSRIFYSDFGLFYQVPMDSGALYSVTNTIDTYVYRCLMVLNNISTASAASTYQAVVGFILILVVNFIVRKHDEENALF